MADHLSRLEHRSEGLDDLPINDDLKDDVLYSIQDKELPWFADMVNYLACGVIPLELNRQQKKRLKREAKRYIWDDPVLLKRGVDGLLRRCVPEEEMKSILHMSHSSLCGGHFGANKTAAKVLQAGFWWPTLLKNAW